MKPSTNIMELPAWPADVPTAFLNKISLAKLLEGDEIESGALYASCKSSGFFLLDLKGCQDGDLLWKESEALFGLAEEMCDIPYEQKMQYALRPGTAFGYKAVGVSKVDTKGTPDRCEFWGLSKDTILAQDTTSVMHPLVAANAAFLRKFVRHAHSVSLCIMSHLETHLKLPEGSLTSLHRLEEPSADQIRLLRMSPQPTADRGTSLLAHTDFGSVTLLWNVVGGLQILPPDAGVSDSDGDSKQWQFVRPQPGCVIVNIGDALVSFTDGVLRSNLHRVTTPPGLQASLERYSVVYFLRPEDNVLMMPLSNGRAEGAGKEVPKDDNVEHLTVKEWVALKTESFQKALAPMQSSGGKGTQRY
ncbi:2OG-Fe(II) oxygenase family protein [Rutstroemia sp. NJR-2017a WRK4]|nr:2OG-Fe(II) oxygenase family protein [Rutstroemia sp. NJR-2017a WRK4]